MLVLINAMKSIVRSKGRNILIGIIVLAIAASSCVALAIRNAANEAETAGVDSINITGTISVDREKLMASAQNAADSTEGGRPDMDSMREMMSQYQDLSLLELQAYSESDYVKNFYYSASVSLNTTEGLEAYGSESSSDSFDDSTGGGFPGEAGNPGGQGGPGGPGRMTMGDFTVTGYSAEDAMSKFISGTSQITDGEMFDTASSDMNCLVSKELAAFNGLSVGDKITLANPNAEDETYEFTIIGIYADSSSSNTGDQMRFSTSMDPANLICTSYDALQSVTDNSASVATTQTDDFGNEQSTAVMGQLSSAFVFGSQDDYEAFDAELTTNGLSEYYTLSSSDVSNYESSLLPLKNLSNFATTMLLVVLVIGAVILIVINVFNIRERKYEVGVLTAIGVKKGKVAMQFVTELLCITLLFIIIGAGVGMAVSVPISNNLLSSQIEQMNTQAENENANFGRPGGDQNFQPGGGSGLQPGGRGDMGGMMSVFGGDPSNVTYLEKINATVNLPIMGQLIGIGIILTLISSLSAVIFVMRYEPLKILTNRT
ncbi:MAG TPA: ABC transporter permease [Ruminococcaceae bacterium]|nr:ABC transporter permease [Oscillospiraceae bacterium]